MKKLSPEAVALVDREIERLRSLSYVELQRYLEPHVETRKAPAGTEYELDVQAVWDDKKAKTLRVMIFVSERGRASLMDSSVDDFIMAPDGSFVGE